MAKEPWQMTIHWLIVACVAFVIAAGVARRRPGDGLATTIVMISLFAAIAIADLVARRFTYTGDIGITVAAVLAGAFALDALYGLMAPERQRRRDRKLRQLLRRRHA
jgi:hypothetical protein